MSGFTISSSDEEVLKALTIANDIRKEFAFDSSSQIRCNIPFQIDDSESGSTQFLENSNLVNEPYESFKVEPEFQAVFQDIQELYLMNDMFKEQKRNLEAETKSYIKDATLDSQEILSHSILEERLHNINLVLKHIETIVDQMSRIKQVLQDEPWKSTLKVSPSCQEDVIQFFQTADVIIKKVQEDVDSEENSDVNGTTKVIPLNENVLHSKLQTIIAGLARRIDILTEFRSHLSTAEDLESGIELGISELYKSDRPRLQSDQISSTDSGLC